VPAWRIPLVDLRAQHRSIAQEVVDAALAIVEEQTFILGEPVERFEQALSRLCRTTHAIGVASGTDALVLALRALGVGRGDAVITSAFSFISSAEAIVRVGAWPIFADVDVFHLTPSSVEAALGRTQPRGDGARVHKHSGAIVRAIVPVHLFGGCVDLAAFRELAARHQLVMVEDAAQAIGAASQGLTAGSVGDAGALSFFPSKNLGGWGDGGAVLTSREDVAAHVRAFRNHGGPEHNTLGTNSRLDALQAAVLNAKARHLERWTDQRVQVAERYRVLLAPLERAGRVRLPPREPPGDRHVYHQFVLRVPRRADLLAHLARAGVQACAYYPRPLHQLGAFAPYVGQDAHFARAEEAAQEALGIPIFPEITAEQQGEVASAIAAFRP
jgi:dTDP-4-amino-4,6-dideoxygalactose transaminase